MFLLFQRLGQPISTANRTRSEPAVFSYSQLADTHLHAASGRRSVVQVYLAKNSSLLKVRRNNNVGCWSHKNKLVHMLMKVMDWMMASQYSGESDQAASQHRAHTYRQTSFLFL